MPEEKTKKVFIYPYKEGSRSALALAKTIGAKLIKLEKSKFQPTKDKVVINWGSSTLPEEIIARVGRVINHPSSIQEVVNKLKFFRKMAANEEFKVNIPPFTTSKDEAKSWLQSGEADLLFARTILTGHSGAGIVKLRTAEDIDKLPNGTLIVKYIRKRNEYRIHISKKGGTKLIQEKKKRAELAREEVDYEIRNLDNGFIFARNEVKPPNVVLEQANLAFRASGLDFGAFDIIYNSQKNIAYVLEVNTSPGLEGSTLEDYADLMKRELVD